MREFKEDEAATLHRITSDSLDFVDKLIRARNYARIIDHTETVSLAQEKMAIHFKEADEILIKINSQMNSFRDQLK